MRALINLHSRSGRLLNKLVDNYVLVLSPAIIREVLEVLHRPGLRAKFPQISQLDFTHIITLVAQAQVIEPSYLPSVSRDPDDDKFLACARSAAADCLVTEDKDLLVLNLTKGPASSNRLDSLPCWKVTVPMSGDLGLDTTSTRQLESNATTLCESTETLRSRSNFSDPSVFLSMLD